MAKLILASASPRRAHLLGGVGLRFDVQPTDVEEKHVPPETAEALAIRLAEAKAQACAAQAGDPTACVLGVDTVVALGERVLGKPKNPEDALAMLQKLRGRTHQVVSGWCMRLGDMQRTDAVSTDVEFTDADDDLLRAYIKTGEPDDKAGAYGIQGIGGFLVRRIHGSYSNVVGLPLAEVLENLAEFAQIRPWQL